jgi:aspartyl-tRNA(Asn)/glutamyl-tRNA(Gln) amidotransferase subunit C
MEEKYWKIDKKLVERIAKVSRIELTEQEIEKLSKELGSILQAFKEIDKVNTSDVDPSFHPQELKNDWRDDKAQKYEWDPLGNTKHKEDRYFKGPRIV